jgi:TIR domain
VLEHKAERVFLVRTRITASAVFASSMDGFAGTGPDLLRDQHGVQSHMYEVFVSYSTKDLQWATYLQQLLTDAQAIVFVAEYDVPPGQGLSDEISQRIDACDLFILLWSRHSEMSQYVYAEVFHAKARQKRILPIMLQRGLRLPDLLGDLKYLRLDQNPQSRPGLAKVECFGLRVTEGTGQPCCPRSHGLCRLGASKE